MYNVSFKSKITPVDYNKFFSEVSRIDEKNFVNYPWTVKESVMSARAYTRNVYDCTVCGITDGAKVLFMHLCPTVSENKNFANIDNFIESKLQLLNKQNGLQGFVLGAQKSHDRYSSNLFDNIVEFLKCRDIPVSSLKFGDGDHHVAYFADKDEWLITNYEITESLKKKMDSLSILKRFFRNVEISELDEIG